MWQNLKDHPITSILGLVGGIATYLAGQEILNQSPAMPQVMSVLAAAVVAVFGAQAKDTPKP